MRPKLLTIFTFLLASTLLRAQQTHVDEVSVDTRATFHQQTTDGVYDSHFQGDHLNLHIKGQLADGLTFRVRQRLNKKVDEKNPFNATDFLWLRWQATDEVNKVMILGGSEIGEMVAAQLLRQQLDAVKIIDIDKQRCRELTEKLPSGVLVSNGDARNSDFLVEEGIRDYDALVAVTGNDEANILSCVVAKKFGVSRAIAQVENLEYLRLAEDMGVDAVINKKLITAGRIFKFTLSDKVRFVRYMSGTDAEVLEYTVAPNARICKAPLKDIEFPRNAIIGGVIRGSESFIAVGDTRIEPYDRVAVFALPDTVKEVDKFFK